MPHTPENGDYSEVEGVYRPEEQGLIGDKHSEGFDQALDDALAKLAKGTHRGKKVRYEIDVEVTNPPGVTEYRAYLG